jgi:cysteine desulfurase/selenocysteine lyase
MTGRLSEGFGDLGGKVWLNAAHQGPLPVAAVEAALEAIRWKLQPHHMTGDAFQAVPEDMRDTLGRLLGVPADEIALANSASYGLHVITHAYPWRDGDEILLVENDFHSDLLPWRLLEDQGVSIRMLKPAGGVPEAEEVEAAIGPRTRLFCSSWVFSFTGWTLDLATVGRVCRDHGVAFVVNASRGLGARPLAPASLSVDALVSVGFKWLCGPYGTGLLWMRPAFRERLRRLKAYWLTMISESDLSQGHVEPDPSQPRDARAYDVFEPANFFNILPWRAAVAHLLDIGIERIAAHDQALVQRLLDGLDARRFRLLSPAEGPERSTLVYLTHVDPEQNEVILARLHAADIHIAARAGSLRIAPHLYNTPDEIDKLLRLLHRG